MSVTVLIPAAGLGRRMGSSVHKQYLCLAGQPVLSHSLALFDSHPLVDHIYVIAPEDQLAFCQRDIIDVGRYRKVRGVIAGGAERQDSVRLGLLGCQAKSDDTVVIHDGVRPLFDGALLERVLAAVVEHGSAVVGVPVKDTIKRVEQGFAVTTPPRATLWAAQTPQAFHYQQILDAHLQAQQQGYRGTDDASLLEWLGHKVAMVEGSYRNLKITTPEDLVIAEALLGLD